MLAKEYYILKQTSMHAFGECQSSLFNALYETCKTYLQFSSEDVQLCWICVYILYKKNAVRWRT